MYGPIFARNLVPKFVTGAKMFNFRADKVRFYLYESGNKSSCPLFSYKMIRDFLGYIVPANYSRDF